MTEKPKLTYEEEGVEMKYYDWTLFNMYGDIIDEGFIYQDSDPAAKSEASKRNPHYEWKGAWKEDKLNGGWFRYNGDARLNSGSNAPTHKLTLTVGR